MRGKKTISQEGYLMNRSIVSTYIKSLKILKRIGIIVAFLSICSLGYGQDVHPIDPKVKNYQEIDKKALHFGFTIGLNALDFSVGHNASAYRRDSLFGDITELRAGFHVNIISEYRLSKYWSVRFLPGLIFGQRNLVYWKKKEELDKEMKIESNLLDFPVMMKYEAKRINNYRPYVIAGGNVRYDMAAKDKYEDAEKVYVRLKPLDYYAEVGFGIDYYLRYFKFTTELKFSLGFRNILQDDPHSRYPEYVEAIDKLNSTAILFSMHFE